VLARAEQDCTVIERGEVVVRSDPRVVGCHAAAAEIFATCTDRCLKARPFDPIGGTPILSLAALEAGEWAIAPSTSGVPPAGSIDTELTITFGVELGPDADASLVGDATATFAFVESAKCVYGLDANLLNVAVEDDRRQQRAVGSSGVVRFTARITQRRSHSFPRDVFAELSGYGDVTTETPFLETSTLAQALFEAHQADVVAAVPEGSLAFPPAATADHFTTLVQHFGSNLHGRHAGKFTLSTATVAMEWAESDAAVVVVPPPPPPITVEEFNEQMLNTSEPGGGDSTGDGGLLDGVTNGFGQTDAAAGTKATDDKGVSSGVLTFAIVVPIFLLAIGVLVYHQHRAHRKVQVMPAGLSFKQPAGVQALPSRGVPGYPDRTLDDVKSPQIRSMPQVPMPNVNPGPESTFDKQRPDDPFA
jgi:hypothetical protein